MNKFWKFLVENKSYIYNYAWCLVFLIIVFLILTGKNDIGLSYNSRDFW